MNASLTFLRRRTWAFAVLLSMILFVINVLISPGFLLPERLPVTLGTLAPFVLVGFASTPAILSGGIDISVGPLATFINCFFIAVLIPRGLGDWWSAIPILLVLAALVGSITGWLVAVVRLHPVVASTGVLFILLGLSVTVSPSPESLTVKWANGLAASYGWFPGAIITIGAAALVWFLLRRTSYVNNLLATGESDISAYGSGVNVTAVRIIAYTLGGLFAGIGGIALSALVLSSQPSLANTYALIGVAAAVLGGTALGGGKGGLVGSFFGAVAIFLLQQLLTVMGVDPSFIQFAYGLALVLGVLFGASLLSSRTKGSH